MPAHLSVRDAYARRVIDEALPSAAAFPAPRLPPDHLPGSEEYYGHAVDQFSEAFNKLDIADQPEDPSVTAQEAIEPSTRKARPRVGIIGAGAAGLYTAMILESLDISFEILEGDNRLGGRLRTHKLGPGPNDYYDAGAMRFPDNPLMKRTFDLFKNHINFTIENGKLNKYYMSTPTDTYMFNDIVAPAVTPVADDIHKFGTDKGGTVPTDYVQKGSPHWKGEKINPIRDVLKKDFDGSGWDALMKVDKYTMRSYMSLVEPSYPNSVVDWCETLDLGTGMYDNALSEVVIDSLEFDYQDKPPIEWYCVQGGAEEIAKAMAKTLKAEHQPQLNKRVIGFFPRHRLPFMPRRPVPQEGQGILEKFRSIEVAIDGEQPREYRHVISTIPLGMLRLVDTRACGFSYALKEALRVLRYDASVKVAIKFDKRWWEEAPYSQKGGKSLTDRPTRVIVYPSNGIGGEEAVLLASYTWSQDALRFGSLVQGKDSKAEAILVDRILADIADLYKIPFADLKSRVKGHDAWDWYHNPFSAGAFAMFGPGQFRHIYPEVTRPAAGGLLHFAGEATSANHAWVVGALNSAYRCVKEMLVHDKDKARLAMLREKWGEVGESEESNLFRQVLFGIDKSTKLSFEVPDAESNANLK